MLQGSGRKQRFPIQSLINPYLRDCTASGRRMSMSSRGSRAAVWHCFLRAVGGPEPPQKRSVVIRH